MPRIVGVDIPNEKAVLIALTYIHGLGRFIAAKILKELGINPNMHAGKLSEDEVSKITQIIDRDYIVEGQLRREVAQNIARLKFANPFVGLFHYFFSTFGNPCFAPHSNGACLHSFNISCCSGFIAPFFKATSSNWS